MSKTIDKTNGKRKSRRLVCVFVILFLLRFTTLFFFFSNLKIALDDLRYLKGDVFPSHYEVPEGPFVNILIVRIFLRRKR